MKIIAWIIRLCIFTFLLLLAIDNSQPLTLTMPLQIPDFTAPTIIILLIAFIIGVIFGLFALLPPLLSAKSANRKLQKILDKQSKNNNNNNNNNNDGDNDNNNNNAVEKIENKK